MAVVRIKDAPFPKKVIRHLLSMGIVEADWGHPEVKLDNPIKYFKDRVRLNDNPTMQMKKRIRNLPSLRGIRLEDAQYSPTFVGPAPKPRMHRLPGMIEKPR